KRIVFLAAREAEKRDDQDSPGSKQKIGALALVEARAPGAYTPRNFLQGGEQKRAPGNDPEQQEAVENQERDFSVVVGDALVQIAHELLVPEVEPEETLLWTGRLRRIADGGQDVPRHGHGEEDDGARKQSQLGKFSQLACDKQEHENNH